MRWYWLLCGCLMAATLVACGGKGPVVPPGTLDADTYLFQRANEELKEENWLEARTYFQQIVDNYPGSALRPDAKLGVGDTYIGEDTPESLVLAANEFREFLQFYPTSTRADYAQYKLAMSHYARMRAPERDQTETRDAVTQFEAFFERFPNSPLAPEVRPRAREARDRLTESSYLVGLYYFRTRWYVGAIARFREILADDPNYSRRDAVYYHLAESLARTDKTAEAVPYFERLLAEYQESEFLPLAQQRLQELKTQ